MASLETPKVDVAYLEFFAPDVRATDQRLPDLAVNASKAGDWGTSPQSGWCGRSVPHDDERRERGPGTVGYGANLVGGFGCSSRRRRPMSCTTSSSPARGWAVSGLTHGQNADALPDPATGELNAVPAYGGYVAYERRWTPQFFSTLIGAGNILKNEVDPTRRSSSRPRWSCSTASTSPSRP
jgi:hypothetical protein